MNTNKHMVTIPIWDYNQLIKASEFLDIVKVTKGESLWNAIDEAAKRLSVESTGKEIGIDGVFEIYYKSI